MTLSFAQLKEVAKEKGYVLTRVDRGSQYSDRHEVWLTGNHDGPYVEDGAPNNFLFKIGIGPTLDIALERAQKDLEERPSYPSSLLPTPELAYPEAVRGGNRGGSGSIVPL